MKAGVLGGHIRRLKQAYGFTIVETMVVLAVTGALFVAIAATLSGRQNAAEFAHAIQSTQAQIQQVINQVAAGFYPNTNGNQINFTCTAGPNGPSFSAGTSGQGANQSCVLLGKVMQFGEPSQGGLEQYRMFTVAGLNNQPAGANSPFSLAQPAVVGVNGAYGSYSEARTLEYGLKTRWIKSEGNTMGAVAFLMEPGGAVSGSTSGYSSGTQQIDLVPLPGTSLNANQTVMQEAAAINARLNDTTLTTDAPINPPGGVQICFMSGGTDQSGLITIGSNGRQLIVSLEVKSNNACL